MTTNRTPPSRSARSRVSRPLHGLSCQPCVSASALFARARFGRFEARAARGELQCRIEGKREQLAMRLRAAECDAQQVDEHGDLDRGPLDRDRDRGAVLGVHHEVERALLAADQRPAMQRTCDLADGDRSQANSPDESQRSDTIEVVVGQGPDPVRRLALELLVDRRSCPPGMLPLLLRWRVVVIRGVLSC